MVVSHAEAALVAPAFSGMLLICLVGLVPHFLIIW
jgi:hypothetical protein